MTKNHSFEGVNIRNARKRASFTQVQLSEATGIDQASVNQRAKMTRNLGETASNIDHR